MATDTQSAVELRESVLAIVAHDIRSPLATIAMIATLLADEDLESEERTHFLHMILGATSQIDRLIHDLVDVAHIEGRGIELDVFRTPMHQLLADIIESFQSRASQRGVRLELDMPVPTLVFNIDRDRIVRLVNNLLDNALKFTPPGGLVTVRCHVSDGKPTLEVSDTGAGIPQDQIEHIFERFWQAQHARRAGAGLGLAICKGIANAHGGTISVDSQLGAGSSFEVQFPSDTLAG